jgi:E3 ubiquitin-protein ligase HUWE1
MVQVMRTMSEVTTVETLAHLSKLVKESLDATKNFWESIEQDSKLLPLVEIAGTSATSLPFIRRMLCLPLALQRDKS